MAIKPIALSFKQTKEDIELYQWIISHSNMSGFIKDTLRSVKENEFKKEDNNCKTDTDGLIDMDF